MKRKLKKKKTRKKTELGKMHALMCIQVPARASACTNRKVRRVSLQYIGLRKSEDDVKVDQDI